MRVVVVCAKCFGGRVERRRDEDNIGGVELVWLGEKAIEKNYFVTG